MKTDTTPPRITPADLIQFLKTGHMADHTLPKWFKGTTNEFVELFANQNYEMGYIEGEGSNDD